MRTDSVRISKEAQETAGKFLADRFGEQYIPKVPKEFKSKKNIQDAHEAIRPTNVEITPEVAKESLSNEQYKLYSLIWKRFMASQMSPCVLNITTIEIINGEYGFKATGSAIDFDGFMKVYEYSIEEEKEVVNLPQLEIGEKLIKKSIEGKQHFTQPPARFSEASLVKTLEENGIGRPSTYAPIISTLLERKYIEREKRTLKTTELGFIVNDILSDYFKNTSNAIIYETTNQLAAQAGLINKNYSSAFSNKYNFFKYSAKDTELNSTCGFDFFSFCKGSLKDIIRNSLKRLYFLKYITFEETYLLSYEYQVRRATDEETEIIKNIEQQVLKDMQIDNKNKLQYNDKLRKRYYDNINNLVMDKIKDVDILYIGYKITINKDNIPDKKQDIKQLKEDLNKLFKERTLTKMQKRKDKYVEGNPYIGQPNPFWGEFVLERLNKNYMQYANYICNMLLDLKTKDIRDYLKL
jgi:hypothetical protein